MARIPVLDSDDLLPDRFLSPEIARADDVGTDLAAGLAGASSALTAGLATKETPAGAQTKVDALSAALPGLYVKGTVKGEALAASKRLRAVTVGNLSEPAKGVTVGGIVPYATASTVPNQADKTAWDTANVRVRDNYRVLGCKPVVSPADRIAPDLTVLTYAPGAQTGNGMICETSYSGTKADLIVRNNGVGTAPHFVFVDDRLAVMITEAQLAAAGISAGNFARVPFTFDAARPRRLRYECDTAGAQFYGWTFDSTIAPSYPATPRGPNVAVWGDSFTEGTGASTGASSLGAAGTGRGFCRWLSWHMGWPDVRKYGSGSTGYYAGSDHSTAGSTRPSLVARYVNDVVNQPADIGIMAMGLNDAGVTLAQATGAAATIWDALIAARPTLELVIVGPFLNAGAAAGGAITAPILALDAALAGMAATRGLRYISPVAEGWRYTTLSGSDPHPDAAGHQTIGDRLAGHLSISATPPGV